MAEGESGAVGLGSSAVLDVDAKWLADNCSGFVNNLILVSESLEKRERDLEKREREFEELKSLQEGRSEELSLREEKLEASQVEVEGLRKKEREKLKKIERREREIEEWKWLQEERSEELSLKEEKLDELLRSVQEHIERLEASQGEMEGLRREEREKLKEIDKRERELSVANGLLERRLDEVGEKLKELDAFRNGRLKEVALREQRFFKERRDFDEEVRLTNEKLKEKQRVGYGIIERLISALDELCGLRVIMGEKLKEIDAHESLTSRAKEAEELKSLLEGRSEELSLKKAMLDEYLRSINEKMETLKAVEGRVEDLRMEQLVELDMIEEKEREVKEREERIAKIEEDVLVEGEEESLLGWQELEEKHKEVEQWLERLEARDKDLDQREIAVRKFELQQHSTNTSTAGVD